MDRTQIIAGLLLGCTLMVSGCRREPLPDTGDGEIRFSAVSLTAGEEPATKSFGSMKENFDADFVANESIMVYGRRNNTRNPLVFYGEPISRNGSTWGYSSPKYWSWKEEEDYYDFLAFYKPPTYDPSLILTNDETVPLALSTYYDVTAHQYDLMLAGKRRKFTDESRLSTVPLVFHRMLCAVGIKVKNISSTEDLYLVGYNFVNLITYGKAMVTAGDDPTYAWSNLSRSAAPAGGTTLASRATVEKTQTYSFMNLGYDLMIPQDHNEHLGTDSYPSLVIRYALSATAETVEVAIPLKDIPVKGSTALISNWDWGVKYEYEIAMNLDGGVQVELTITPWDEIEAETPGLLIPPDWNAPTTP